MTVTSQRTICLLRGGYGMDLDRYVDRCFRSEETAREWENRQPRIVNIVILPGRWHRGDRVPFGTKGTPLGYQS